jgi:protein phosphatase
MKVESYGDSDIGLSRLNNEDVFACLSEEKFYTLADGMGGHNAGEVAAQMTVKELCKKIQKAYAYSPTPEQWKELVEKAIFDTNLKIYQTSEKNAEQRGMGTTLCLALIVDEKILIAHVGDSRIYRFRKGRLSRLTHDHSLTVELIARGELDEESAKTYPKKNVITRAIGTQITVDPELRLLDIEPGDLYLLCSDGLSDPVSDMIIANCLDATASLKIATEKLILAAKEAGGGDNITLLTFRIS